MKILFLFLMLVASASAEPVSLVVKALKHEELNSTERKELVALVVGESDLFQKILKERLPKSLKESGVELLKEIKADAKEDEGKNRLGAGVGWFVNFEGNELSSLPIISNVRKGSPSESGKLKLGDVIKSAEGVSFQSAHSRNLFIHLLKIWPVGTPLSFEVLRNSKQPELDERVLRNEAVSVSVSLGKEEVR